MVEQPIAVADAAVMASSEDGPARGRESRERTLLMATIRIEGEGPGYPLRVRNLSGGGLMAECDRRLVKGERVSIELRNIGSVGATIAWADGGRVGIQFDRAIDPKAARRPVVSGAMPTSTIIVAASGRRPGLR